MIWDISLVSHDKTDLHLCQDLTPLTQASDSSIYFKIISVQFPFPLLVLYTS